MWCCILIVSVNTTLSNFVYGSVKNGLKMKVKTFPFLMMLHYQWCSAMNDAPLPVFLQQMTDMATLPVLSARYLVKLQAYQESLHVKTLFHWQAVATEPLCFKLVCVCVCVCVWLFGVQVLNNRAKYK